MPSSLIPRRKGAAPSKVLDAAEEVFAERGVKGATIDEVASRAGMAKSHVYYHFTGKQQILDRLIEVRLGEILTQKDALISEIKELTVEAVTSLARKVIHEVLAPRSRFLRAVLFEAFSSGDGDGPELLGRLFRPWLDDELKRYEAAGFAFDRERFVSDHLHFGLLPVLMHLAFSDRLTQVAGVPKKRALELVIDRAIEVQLETMSRMNAVARRPETKKPKRPRRKA